MAALLQQLKLWAPAQVRQLALQLELPELAARAESAAVGAPWEGSNRQDLIEMLGGLPVERVRKLVHHPARGATSELQVLMSLKCSSTIGCRQRICQVVRLLS